MVSLRVDDHNLEDALRLKLGSGYRLTINSTGEAHARDYVAERFTIVTTDGLKLELNWVGWEWSPGAAWMHFEFPGAGDLDRVRLANTIFLDRSTEQVNTVNVRSRGHRHTLTLQAGFESAEFRSLNSQEIHAAPTAPTRPAGSKVRTGVRNGLITELVSSRC